MNIEKNGVMDGMKTAVTVQLSSFCYSPFILIFIVKKSKSCLSLHGFALWIYGYLSGLGYEWMYPARL